MKRPISKAKRLSKAKPLCLTHTCNSTGFTLVEVMIVIAIVGLLASIAIASYRDLLIRANMAEPLVLLGALKTEVVTGFNASGDFPLRAGESTARTIRPNGRTSRAPATERIVRTPDSELMVDYRYEVRPGQNRAWLELRMDRRQLEDCGNRCRIYFGFQETQSGQLATFCGTWTAGRNFRFPAQLMPPACTSTCVRCDLNRARNQ